MRQNKYDIMPCGSKRGTLPRRVLFLLYNFKLAPGATMKNKNSKSRPHRNRIVLACASAAILFFALSPLCLATEREPRTYHESGVLNAVEAPHTATINGKSYLIDPTAIIENEWGRPIPLFTLVIPIKVDFAYCYMARTPKNMIPVIVYIKVPPKSPGNKKVSR